jgi:hypothetical protein
MKISRIWPSKSRSFMSEGQGLAGYFKGYSWRLLFSSLKTIHSKITKLQPITAWRSKIWTFNLEGQGHLRMKVKVRVVYWKVLSQGFLWPSMKTIYQEIKKLWSRYKFADGNGNGNADPTITIPLLFFQKKSPAKNRLSIYRHF